MFFFWESRKLQVIKNQRQYPFKTTNNSKARTFHYKLKSKGFRKSIKKPRKWSQDWSFTVLGLHPVKQIRSKQNYSKNINFTFWELSRALEKNPNTIGSRGTSGKGLCCLVDNHVAISQSSSCSATPASRYSVVTTKKFLFRLSIIFYMQILFYKIIGKGPPTFFCESFCVTYINFKLQNWGTY